MRSYLMKKSFGTIKESSSSYRIQLGMTYQSYIFPILMIFLSYKSKEPYVGLVRRNRKLLECPARLDPMGIETANKISL
jgi:hypothetical protein